MAQICTKHDVKFGDSEKCWCCELLEATAPIPEAPKVVPIRVPIPAGDHDPEVGFLEHQDVNKFN